MPGNPYKNYRKYIRNFRDDSILDYLGSNIIIKENNENHALELMELMENDIRNNFNFRIAGSAISAMKHAHISAMHGMASAAFENTRFFLERVALLKEIAEMGTDNNPYQLALEHMEWHRLIDKKFIIYGLQQFTGRIWHYTGKDYIPRGISIFLSGVPLCGIHSKSFTKYSRTVEEIETETGIMIREKCAKCGRDAVRFTIALPKAGAILGMLGLYTGHDVSDLGKFYASYSRVLHPYGFYNYPENYLTNLWSLDFIRLVLTLQKIIF
jgi:hypothetical protein